MYLEIEMTTLTPVVHLFEPDDLGAFKVVLRRPDVMWVKPDELVARAGARARDPAWRSDLDAMVAYAREHGWLRADGAIRAHVEHQR